MTTQVKTIHDKSVIFKEINAKGDRFINFVLSIYFLLGIGMSFVYETYLVGVGVGTLCLLAYFATKIILPKSSVYQYVLGVVLALFAAQFIYQMHGLFEMHFFVFLGSAILIAYQNWRLQLPLILVVVLHHGLFAFLQFSGNAEIYFTQLAYMDIATFAIHGALAAAIAAVCGWWSYDSEKRTIRDYYNTTELENGLSNVTKNIAFAEEISKGNFAFESDTNDAMGNGLRKMQKSLSISTNREQQEKFITIGINTISEILRANNASMEGLCNELIRGIVKYMGLNQGGIFLVEGDGADEHLKLTSCYAYDRKKFLEKRIEIGDGLIGQCYLERDVIYLKDLPSGYIRITSGLGDAPPSNVLLAPIQTQDTVVGVLELASFKEMDQSKIDFVKRICESIASSIVSTRITDKVQKLLVTSQQQTEELRAQEEEVRQNMEELSATQEELQRRGWDMEGRVKALNESGMATIEFDPKGFILSANESFLNLMGYTQNEVEGKHHKMFVEPTYSATAEYKKFWDDLSNGISKPGEYTRVTKSGDKVHIKGSYSIIIDQEGKVSKIIKCVTDVTSIKLQISQLAEQEDKLNKNLEEMRATQFEMQRKEEELNQQLITTQKAMAMAESERKKNEAILEGCMDAVISFDESGTIAYFNKAAEEMFGYSRYEMIGSQAEKILAIHMIEDKQGNVMIQSATGNEVTIRTEINATDVNGQEIALLLTATKVKIDQHFLFTLFAQKVSVDLF